MYKNVINIKTKRNLYSIKLCTINLLTKPCYSYNKSILNNTYTSFLSKRYISSPSIISTEKAEEIPSINNEEKYLILDSEEYSILLNQKNDDNFRHMANIHALLRMGKIERAYNIMRKLKLNNPNTAKNMFDIHVYNSFILAYMQAKPTPMIKKAMDQFSRLEQKGVKANLTTFAIVIKGHINANKLNLMKLFYQEMQRFGYSLEMLKSSAHLSDQDLDTFFKAIGLKSEIQNISIPSESLLENVPTDTQNDHIYESKLLATDVHGVRLLKDSLSKAFSKSLSLDELQLKLEETAIESVVEKMRHEKEARNDNLLKLNLPPIRKMMVEWREKLTIKIDEKQRILMGNDADPLSSSRYSALFCCMKADKMALIAIQSLLSHFSASEGRINPVVSAVVAKLGKQIEQEYHAEQIRNKGNRYLYKEQQETKKLFASGKLFSMALRKAQAKIEREKIDSDWIPKWPPLFNIKLGSFLLSSLIDTATFRLPDQEVELPAFSHGYEFNRGTKRGIILFDPHIKELLSQSPNPSSFGARLLPMLVLPKPWLTYNSGSYYTTRQKCMRSKDAFEQSVYLKKADQTGKLTHVLICLDALGSVKWRINKDILEVVKAVWNTGQSFLDIPKINPTIELPEKPADITDSTAMREYRDKCRQIEIQARNDHSLRCDVNYKVEIANAFKDHEFYFPHNLDFRGRTYPIPPLFNHLGNDLCRGLLMFSERKTLGKRGLDWLKIHLASLTGFDKASFEDRIKFSESNLDKIKDSAENPLNGHGWWKKAEDPWQCLAACIELNNAMKLFNPEEYQSSLPIHQDGTCNGLQHYAALGLDIQGAKHVNLEDSIKPQDIYSGVLELVKQKIEKDFNNQVKEAIVLKDKVTRKVIKQTVMTNVYGVTFMGANAQILNQLKNIDDLDYDIAKLSYYLTESVFASLGELFSSAQAIQAWLNECAGRIANSIPEETLNNNDNNKTNKKKKKVDNRDNISSKKMTSVIWTTPLGLTIAQPYRKGVARNIRTNLQNVYIYDTNTITPVNTRKQRTAFPPNFIHSLDASHMMFTCLKMAQDRLAFASVHDSYWTHAADVDTMNQHIREQFIHLHSQPLLENLLNEFKFRYKGYKRRAIIHQEKQDELKFESKNPIFDIINEDSDNNGNTFIEICEDKKINNNNKKLVWIDLEFPPLPKCGDFDLNKVKDSTYFFH